MLGPLFRYELKRLARRGLQPRLRAAFAGLLLVVLLLAYLAAFPGVSPLRLLVRLDEPLTTEAASRFGQRFVSAFLVVQTLAVMLVTPALVAGAVSEEKERRTLDLLLTTALTDREVVVGKLAARLVFVGMLLLTGLPVVVLTVFFGGVDAAQLAAGFALALFTMCSLGAYSLWLATTYQTLAGALVRAYPVAAFVALAGLMFSCFHFPAFVSPLGTLLVLLTGWPGFMSPNTPADPVSLLAWYGAVHLVLAALFLRDSARRLREPGAVSRLAVVLNMPAPPRDDDLPPVASVEPAAVPFRLRNVPEVDDADPLGWKERHFGGWAGLSREALQLTCFCLMHLALLVALLQASVIAWWAPLVVFLAGGAGVAGAGFRAAVSVVQERQQGTLDGLLTLPVDRRAILLAKARAAAALALWPGAVAVLASSIGVIRGVLAWPTLLGVPLVYVGWVVGVVGFGMWLSVRCATRERAVGWFLSVIVGACVLAPLLGNLVDASIDPSLASVPPHFARGFSSVVSLWNATPRAEGFWVAAQVDQFLNTVLAAVVVGALGVGFGTLAARAFERKAS